MIQRIFFSVIINCHNSEEFLSEAINSVISQSFNDYEIIIYDNASTDRTREIASEYSKHVKYFYSKTKLTLGAARNKAISFAAGKYLAFLDSDDVWLSNKLEVQHKVLVSNSKIALCGSDAFRVDESLRPITKFSTGRFSKNPDSLSHLLADCYIPMSSVVIDRDICLSLNGFNESYEIVEEWDLWIRATTGNKLFYIRECLVNIRFHGSNTSRDYHAQQVEVLRMFNQISTDAVIERRQVKKALTIWKLRYIIVRIFNYKEERTVSLISLLLHLLVSCLVYPRTLFKILSSYASLPVLRFATRKYITRRK